MRHTALTASELDRRMHHPVHEHEHKPEPEHDRKEPHEFHVRRLHDGTYHHQRTYLSDHAPVEGSGDLDSVHDALEEHFGEPNEGESEGESERR